MTPRTSILLLAWLLLPSAAPACNVPVFRYALERWQTDRPEDRYEIYVFHRGPLAAADQAALARIRAAVGGHAPPANGEVDAVDLTADVDPDVRKLWENQKDAPLPWVVIRYPNSPASRPDAWAGPLSSPVLTQLVTSPARRELARRIMNGDSVAWLLLESGDAARDRAAGDLLAAELPRLERAIKLPDPKEDSSKLLSDLPLRLRFSVLRVARDDPDEQLTIALLSRGNRDWTGADGPVVFPVFGRNRALDGIAGADLNPARIERDATYLCGACSCEVKRLNPGVDLLTAVDWDSILPEPPPAEGETVPIPNPAARAPFAPPPEWPTSRVLVICGIALAALLALVTGTLALRSRTNDASAG
jgi:hypothetical protein